MTDRIVSNMPDDGEISEDSADSHMSSVIRLENSYNREAAFIRFALDNAAIVAITDTKGTITYVNDKFCQISGYSRDELIGSNHRMLRSGKHDTDFFRSMYRQIGRGEVWHGEICNRSKNGDLYWVDTTIVPHSDQSGKVDSYTAIRFDITRQKKVEAEILEQATLDALTGLANRRGFKRYLADALVKSRDQNSGLSLALLDLDTFKDVNDSFGHDAGDSLLRRVAEILKPLTSESIFISRLGGDEFGIVFTDHDHEMIEKYLHDIRDQFHKIQTDRTRSRQCCASIGLAHFPEDAHDKDSLFKAADLALYAAKAAGRDRVEVFHQSMRTALDDRLALLRDVASGLANNQFELYYQPIVPNDPNRNISFEALLRWNHPSGDVWAPGRFKTALDDPQTAGLIGQFVLRRVFGDSEKFIAEGIDYNVVAFNLTDADLRSRTFIDSFKELTVETGIPPERFSVEITEGIFLGHERDYVLSGLQRLHDLGVRVAFDDFGTGFASLTHLRQIPISHVKIDRSFVINVETSVADQAIIEGVIHISHKMGQFVVVEGVETKGQLDMLHKMGCDAVQGYYFAKPQPVGELKDVVGRINAMRMQLA